MKSKLMERGMEFVFAVCACCSIAAVALICVFLFANGVPAMAEIGVFDFLIGTKWAPGNQPAAFGILPMIVGSIYVTAGAIVVGVPIGLLTAVFMARFCPKKLYPVLHPMVELLAGIPSIVYGFFGMAFLVPLIRNLYGGSGQSVLTASILLGIMILPTIIGGSEAAIRAVPWAEEVLDAGVDAVEELYLGDAPDYHHSQHEGNEICDVDHQSRRIAVPVFLFPGHMLFPYHSSRFFRQRHFRAFAFQHALYRAYPVEAHHLHRLVRVEYPHVVQFTLAPFQLHHRLLHPHVHEYGHPHHQKSEEYMRKEPLDVQSEQELPPEYGADTFLHRRQYFLETHMHMPTLRFWLRF